MCVQYNWSNYCRDLGYALHRLKFVFLNNNIYFVALTPTFDVWYFGVWDEYGMCDWVGKRVGCGLGDSD